jgi:hypothetical protein
MLMPPFKVLNIVVCPLSTGSSGRIRGMGAILKLADAKDDLVSAYEVGEGVSVVWWRDF